MINYEPLEPKGIIPLCIKRCFKKDALNTTTIVFGIVILIISTVAIICTVE